MFQQFITSVLESTINQALSLDIDLHAKTHNLVGKSLTLHLTELGFPLSFVMQNSKINVLACAFDQCEIFTDVKTLRDISQSAQLTELIKSGKLDVKGDLQIAQAYSSFANQLELDWQTKLASHIGDYSVYTLTKLGTFVKTKAIFAQQQIKQDSSEWLLHEKNIIATKSHLSQFNKQVLDVVNKTDKLEARLLSLQANITP